MWRGQGGSSVTRCLFRGWPRGKRVEKMMLLLRELEWPAEWGLGRWQDFSPPRQPHVLTSHLVQHSKEGKKKGVLR